MGVWMFWIRLGLYVVSDLVVVFELVLFVLYCYGVSVLFFIICYVIDVYNYVRVYIL